MKNITIRRIVAVLVVTVLFIVVFNLTSKKDEQENHSKTDKTEYNRGYRDAIMDMERKSDDRLLRVISLINRQRNSNDPISQYLFTEKQIKNIIKKSNPKISETEKQEYVKWITRYSKRFKLNPILVASIIHKESNFIRTTRSSVGAIGPMQVYPKHHKEKLKKYGLTPEHLFTIRYGVLVGCEILHEYLEQEDGDFTSALYKYVGGKRRSYVRDIYAMYRYAFSVDS